MEDTGTLKIMLFPRDSCLLIRTREGGYISLNIENDFFDLWVFSAHIKAENIRILFFGDMLSLLSCIKNIALFKIDRKKYQKYQV